MRDMHDTYEMFHGVLAGRITASAVDEGTALIGARYGEWVDAHGEPVAAFLPRQQFFLSQVELARALNGHVGADDVAIVALPYELGFVGHVVERTLELIGTTTISVGTSNTICPMPRTLELMRRYGASVLVATPTVALELARWDESRSGSDRCSLRSLVVTGEACSPGRLDRIASLWGASCLPLVSLAAMPVIAAPCRRGEMHLTGEWLSAEVGNPSEARVARGGHRGELRLVPPRRSADGGEVSATGELVELRPAGWSCECGDPKPVILPLGPAADAVSTPSGPVTALDVERLLYDQVALEPDFSCRLGDGRFHVTCTPARGAQANRADLDRLMADRLRSELGIDIAVTIAEPPATEGDHT